MSKQVSLICNYCQKEFSCIYKQRNLRKFCNRSCSSLFKNKIKNPWVKKNCLYCKKDFELIQWRINQGEGIYCSRSCVVSHNNILRTLPPSEIFFRSIIIPEDKNQCWLSKETKDAKSKYPRITIKNKMILTHRFSYEYYKGKIPNGLILLHSCDQPRCCNPLHLRTGTHQDNSDDKMQRKRNNAPKGERHGNVKLTESQAREIKLQFHAGIKRKDIAIEFKISISQVYRIAHGNRWKHIA